jgi:hypothetical protein
MKPRVKRFRLAAAVLLLVIGGGIWPPLTVHLAFRHWAAAPKTAMSIAAHCLFSNPYSPTPFTVQQVHEHEQS